MPERKTEAQQDPNQSDQGSAPEKLSISVYAVSALENLEPEDMGEPILQGWDFVSFGPDGVDFSLNFTDPIEVSAGEEPDLLLV